MPLDRVLGEVDHGWSIAMDLLPYERSTALWHRASYLQRRLEQLVAAAPAGALDPVAVGEATELLWAFRARSRGDAAPARRRRDARDPRRPSTRCWWRRPSRRSSTSSPKGSAPTWRSGDDPVSQRWRAEFLYSRAATIYGGSAEIQRNIIARRLLDLGADR